MSKNLNFEFIYYHECNLQQILKYCKISEKKFLQKIADALIKMQQLSGMHREQVV